MPRKPRIRKGDRVVVISGKDKGAEGRVLEVFPAKQRVIVEGINTITRHEKVRMSRRGAQEGGIQHKEASVHLSNVALIDPDGKPTRIGYRMDGEGKVRISKRSGAEL